MEGFVHDRSWVMSTSTHSSPPPNLSGLKNLRVFGLQRKALEATGDAFKTVLGFPFVVPTVDLYPKQTEWIIQNCLKNGFITTASYSPISADCALIFPVLSLKIAHLCYL